MAVLARRRLAVITITILTCALMGILMVLPQQAHAVTAAEKQAEADAAQAELSQWQVQLDQASDAYYEANTAHDEAIQKMNEAQAQIDAAEAKKATLQDHLSTRAKSMYRSGNTTFIDVLLGADSFEDFVSTWDTLNALNADDESYVEQEKQAEAQATAAHNEYSAQEQTASDKLAEAESIEAQAQSTVQQYQARVSSLDAEAQQLLQQEQAAAQQAAANAAAAASSSSSSDDSGSSSGGGSASGSYEGGSDTVSRAYACLGAPYVWGAVGPGGYDCSGLVSYCITGSHTRVGTASTFAGWPQASNPEPGDICANSHHCGIYIGGGQMINAFDFGVGVIISSVDSDMVIVVPQ